MSAPLVVNTRDGVCWTRRTVTPGGIALYAPESAQTCPNFVMATLAELAEHGIAGSADALPVPAGPKAQTDEMFVPRTELRRWQDIADALNAAHAADMPVSIDLDGTLTDHRTWSVVWDQAAARWTVAGYEADAEQSEERCDHPNGYGPYGCAGCGAFRPADDEDDVTPQVPKLRGILAGQREQAEAAPSAAALLATPCDACRHTLNWHRNGVGCTVPRCVCGSWQQPADEAGQGGDA